MSSKISALTALAAASVDTAADLLAIVDTSATATKKITPDALRTALAAPKILGHSAIPFIALSSGSVSAAGAITGITALPAAYPAAYCWFPANILATVKAAGWYYCTFSTTTAGTAFLDTYTTGTPSIPSSPTAVTDGKGAFTGATTELFGPTITLAAGALGTAGVLRGTLMASTNNNANAKTFRLRWSGTAGTPFLAVTVASLTGERIYFEIHNVGSAAIQKSFVVTNGVGLGTTGGTQPFTAAVDSSVATTIVVSVEHATATDNLVIDSYLIEVIE